MATLAVGTSVPLSFNRRSSGSFMLTNELTRQEMMLQDSQARTALRRGSTAPYVTANTSAPSSADSGPGSDYSKALTRLEFYYLMGKLTLLPQWNAVQTVRSYNSSSGPPSPSLRLKVAISVSAHRQTGHCRRYCPVI